MAEKEEILFTFKAQAYPEDKFALVRMQGHEGISELYRIDVDLVSADPDIDHSKLVNQPAMVVIDRDGDLSIFQGIVASFELRDQGPEFVNYHAVLVPRLYRLDLTRRSQIFQEKNVKTIVDEVLKANGLAAGQDYDLKLTGSHPASEYVVQYEESDLNFIRRLMEHEGVFFFFEHGQQQEKLIIADSKDIHKPIVGDAEVLFRDARAVNPAGEAVSALTFRQQMLPKSVLLKDYNYRKPSLEIKGKAEAVAKGFGEVIEYGDHFKTPEEGDALAKIRAEELKCREKLFFGESAVRAFRCGHKFTLTDHFRSGNNMEYLLVEVDHFGEQLGVVGTASGGQAERPSYTNQFQAIPAAVQFRPARITLKPRVSGIMHATVDSSGSGQYAEIDDSGRYKVRLPFDLSGAGAAKASRFIRMAQPYSGAEYGMHFPLHKDTEVMLIHLDGDPDRPIIAGTVPNPNNSSPVNAANHTQCRIRTGSDNEILIEDTQGSEYVLVRTPAENSYVSLGADHHSEHAPPGVSIGSKAGITVNAGKGIQISAGAAGHDNGVNAQSQAASKVSSLVSIISAGAAAATGIAMDCFAGGIGAIVGIAGDVAGFAGGVTLPGVYISAPGKVFLGGMSEVVMGGGANADMVATATANVMSAGSAMLCGLTAGAVVSIGNVEAVSIVRNVKLHAKLRDVEINGKRRVIIKAVTNDAAMTAGNNVFVQANKDFSIRARDGKGRVRTEQDLTLESMKSKKVGINAGKSSIVLDDKSVTIQAEGEKVSVLAKEELRLECGDSFIVLRKNGQINIQGKNVILESDGGGLTLDDKSFLLEGDKGKVSSMGELNVEATATNTIKGAMVKIN